MQNSNSKKQKVGIYTPYLDTLGGGEKYMLTIAETFLERGDEVYLFLGTHLYDLNTEEIVEKAKKILGIDLTKLNFIKGPFGAGSSAFERYSFLKKYDVFFYLTDGSIFYANAKKNILHFQVPFEGFNKSIPNRIKLKSWDHTIYNSVFTKKIVEKNWPISQSSVLYPPVNVEDISAGKKENIIISVGRFHLATRSKKHEVMVSSFKQLVEEKKIKSWKLVLAGGMEKGNEGYIDELKELAGNAAIEFLPNIAIEELHHIYSKAKIYWHAAGFGEDDPKKHEHFGITTVEAMAAECVPVVINKGGQTEIVKEECGYLWDSVGELIEKTAFLIKEEGQRKEMAENAAKRARDFDKSHFKESLLEIVG